MVDVTALRKLTEQATPGRWQAAASRSGRVIRQAPPTVVVAECGPHMDDDAAFIATFGPVLVAAMLDAVEMLQEAKRHVPHGTQLREDCDAVLARFRAAAEGEQP